MSVAASGIRTFFCLAVWKIGGVTACHSRDGRTDNVDTPETQPLPIITEGDTGIIMLYTGKLVSVCLGFGGQNLLFVWKCKRVFFALGKDVAVWLRIL